MTVEGGLIATADGVMIDHFNIEPLSNPSFFSLALGVLVAGPSDVVSGVEIKDNTISGSIVLMDADGNKLDGNRAAGNT